MDNIIQNQAIWASVFSLILLLIFILRWRTNAFVTLLSCAILAALFAGMRPDAAFSSVTHRSFATGFMGLIAAIPVFFDVALIILLPFIMKLARKAKKKPLFFGLPLCAGLAIGHAFIPPTPGPIAIAELLGANLGGNPVRWRSANQPNNNWASFFSAYNRLHSKLVKLRA